MKTFASVDRFRARLQKSLAWDGEHTIRIGQRSYTMYEYGPGPGVTIGYDYAIFRNANTGEMIEIKYDCPSFQYVNGERIQTKNYRFIDLDVYTAEPWR